MYLKEGGRGKKKVRKREEGRGKREEGRRKKEKRRERCQYFSRWRLAAITLSRSRWVQMVLRSARLLP
jgi:hypothetical protein